MASGLATSDIHLLSDYTIEELIGSGSFSKVYKAKHNERSEIIAIKIYQQKKDTITNYKLAAKEIAFLKLLDHPYVVKLKFYEINDSSYAYIETEYALFGSLKGYINDKRCVPESVVQHVMKQLLEGLSYLHEIYILHGDVKPENILCTNISEKGPMIKITDFGISEIILKDKVTIFKSGSFMYMAPEVLFGSAVDCSSDLWSAGVVMYVMMFNRFIFLVPEKDSAKYKSYLKRKMQPNWNGCESFSDNCNNLAKNLLSYNRKNRFKGKKLWNHPFLNIGAPARPTTDKFLADAEQNINRASESFNGTKYSESLISATEAVLRLKIYYNLIGDPSKQLFVKKKWEQYQEFLSNIEQALTQQVKAESSCPVNCDDDEFRKYLASTPKLLDGFDIGCTAEKFLKEGKKDRALHLFHEALQLTLPLMKQEFNSNRKKIFGRRLKQWLDQVDILTEERDATQQAASHNS